MNRAQYIALRHAYRAAERAISDNIDRIQREYDCYNEVPDYMYSDATWALIAKRDALRRELNPSRAVELATFGYIGHTYDDYLRSKQWKSRALWSFPKRIQEAA